MKLFKKTHTTYKKGGIKRALGVFTTVKYSKSIDKRLLFIPIFLAIFSLIEIFSASRFKGLELKGNEFYFVILHAFWVSVATVLGFIAYLISPKTLRALARYLYLISIILLALIFLAPSYNGAHRWFQIGNFTTFQPSELAKIFLILYAAYYLSKKTAKGYKNYTQHLKKELGPFLLVIGIPLLLILLEPDLSTTLVIGATLMSMFLYAHPKHWFKDMSLFIILLFFMIFLAILTTGYRGQRLQVYLNLIKTGEIPDKFGKGYQLYNILLGIGSGGLWGKGIGQSRQKEGYLLETTAFTDSISAVIFEELGFILSTFFIGIYFYYFYLLIKHALMAKYTFHQLVLWGIAHLILLQALIHFGANLALIPLTGIALPFVTYGGSSLLSAGILAGIALRLAKET